MFSLEDFCRPHATRFICLLGIPLDNCLRDFQFHFLRDEDGFSIRAKGPSNHAQCNALTLYTFGVNRTTASSIVPFDLDINLYLKCVGVALTTING